MFPDLNAPPFGGQDFQTNLIMPEPTVFLNRKFPPVSIIRPTETQGAAMGAVKALTADGLFIGQSPQFFAVLQDLAREPTRPNAGRKRQKFLLFLRVAYLRRKCATRKNLNLTFCPTVILPT